MPCVLFTNKGYTDLKLLKDLFVSENGIGTKFQQLNKIMQDLFLQWLPHEKATFENRYIDPFDLMYMREFQEGIEFQHGSSKKLLEKITSNMGMIENIAAEMFRYISNQVKDTPMDMKVNPYTISLINEVDTTSVNALSVNEAIKKDVDVMWFYNKK